MAWHYDPEQSVTEQDKRVYTKLHSAQPESSIGLGYQTAFLSIFLWGKRLADYVVGTIGRRSYYSIRGDIGFKKGISPCTVRVGVYTRNGMRVIFGMAVSLLLETDAQEDVLLQLA